MRLRKEDLWERSNVMMEDVINEQITGKDRAQIYEQVRDGVYDVNMQLNMVAEYLMTSKVWTTRERLLLAFRKYVWDYRKVGGI